MDENVLLASVVELNEGAKEMRLRAFAVRLRAFDAIVRSARSRSLRLAGFREVSQQMQRWGADLGRQLDDIGGLCQQAVLEESQALTRRRRRRLFWSGFDGPRATTVECCRRLKLEDERLSLGRSANLHALVIGFEALGPMGLMAILLSNTALIEAAGADTEEQALLTGIARDFGVHANAVSEMARCLLRRVRELNAAPDVVARRQEARAA